MKEKRRERYCKKNDIIKNYFIFEGVALAASNRKRLKECKLMIKSNTHSGTNVTYKCRHNIIAVHNLLIALPRKNKRCLVFWHNCAN